MTWSSSSGWEKQPQEELLSSQKESVRCERTTPTDAKSSREKRKNRFSKHQWLRGQAVKTSPFHGGNTGSIPVGVIFIFADVAQFAIIDEWSESIIGRAADYKSAV